MKKLYTVHPPRLEPVDVWADNEWEAKEMAAMQWGLKGSFAGMTVDYHPQDNKAALAGATAQSGKDDAQTDNAQPHITTGGEENQHAETCFGNEPTCQCRTCVREVAGFGQGQRCCIALWGPGCPVEGCGHYLPLGTPVC